MTLYSACCGDKDAIRPSSRSATARASSGRSAASSAERVEVALGSVLAQLLLDGAELLAEDRLALVLADLAAHVLIDLALHLGERARLDHQPGDEAEPLHHVDRVEHADLLVGGEAERRGHPVGEEAGILLRVPELGDGAVALHELAHVLGERPGEEPRVGAVVARLGRGRAVGQPERVGPHDVAEREAAERLERDAVVAAGRPRHVDDADERADGVEVGSRGDLDGRVHLRGDADDVSLGDAAHERDRSLAADGERDHRAGEEDPVAEGQERERRRGGRWTSGGHGHRRLPPRRAGARDGAGDDE
jgi:hypothetical protein